MNMNTELYRLEKKLKISGIKECTASETEAVERILAQGKALPEGIFKSKRGRYYKFIASGMDLEEKKMYVNYRLLLYSRRGVLCLYVIIALLASILAAVIFKLAL